MSEAPKLWLSLYDLEGVALIIAAPTGVTYSNQVGGHACLQPTYEGALLPVNPDRDPDGPRSDLETALGEALLNQGFLDDALADAVDAILARFYATAGLTVDRTRLRESTEAWVHVIAREAEGGAYGESRYPAGRGVLTWLNSD